MQARLGNVLRILKFAFGYVGRQGSPILTVTGGRRVTRVGKYLRTFKIDELPQLINVLKGDMSVVGPSRRLRGCRSLLPGTVG